MGGSVHSNQNVVTAVKQRLNLLYRHLRFSFTLAQKVLGCSNMLISPHKANVGTERELQRKKISLTHS